jgi:hypothetical protein
MSENKTVKASCTWGEGEDVLVTLEGHNFMLYENPKNYHRAVHGIVEVGSFFLTAKEAKELAIDLMLAAKNAEELDELSKGKD